MNRLNHTPDIPSPSLPPFLPSRHHHRRHRYQAAIIVWFHRLRPSALPRSPHSTKLLLPPSSPKWSDGANAAESSAEGESGGDIIPPSVLNPLTHSRAHSVYAHARLALLIRRSCVIQRRESLLHNQQKSNSPKFDFTFTLSHCTGRPPAKSRPQISVVGVTP